MAAWAKYLSFVVVFLLSFVLLWNYFISDLPGRYKAVILRLIFVTLNNIVTIICSIYAWKRTSIFIDHIQNQSQTFGFSQWQCPSVIKSKNNRNKTLCKFVFVTFVLFGTSSWYMPYIHMFRPSQETHWVPFSSYLCLGFLLQFMSCLFFINFLKWLRHKYNWFQSNTRTYESNKHHRSQVTDVPIAAVYALMCCMYGLHITSLPQEIVSVEIPIVGLPKSLDGYRIAQMTDIHLGPTVGREKLEQVVNIVNTMNADAAVIVGDLVDGPVDTLGDVARVIKDIKVKGGKYFVTGNHEYYSSDVDEWFAFLRNLGYIVLHNEHVKIEEQHSKEFFYLAGTDDLQAIKLGYTGHGFDLDKAVGSCDHDHPIVLLAHQPNAAQKALESKYNIKLVLSGHTHGGQMFPFTLFIGLFNTFPKGLYEHGSSYVYVSQGTMYWGIPFRIGTIMEITEVILRAK